jgi:flavodoxin
MPQSDRLNSGMTGFSVHCIYASTSGNVEVAVEAAAKVWQELGWDVQLHRAEQTSIELIRQENHFLLATSTWEHGALNPFFVPLFKAMSQEQFNGKQAAFLGLGDQRYEPVLFCQGMEIVKQVWQKNQGEIIGFPLKVNGEPYAQLDRTVIPWAKQIAQRWQPATTTNGLQSLLGSFLKHA